MKQVLSMEKYEKNGEEKTSYKEIGTIFESRNGNEFLKLHILPGQMFLIKEKEERQESSSQVQKKAEDVPF